ncbi:hypothetical protein ACFSYD_22310 [Paracoccus aerius]
MDSLTGGADTFVFGPRGGLDTVMDFRQIDGDCILLLGTGLSWRQLDTNRSGSLGDGDAYVSSNGTDTVIDIGAACLRAAGVNAVTLLDVTGLVEADFTFA